MALAGFFDDLKLPRGPRLSGVAGFLFDAEGLKKFDEEFEPKIAGLSKPYRTAACNAQAPPFNSWLREDCERLMRDLAKITADTRDAGFIAAVEMCEYQAFIAKRPSLKSEIGNEYTLSLLALVSSVVDYVKEAYPGETIYLWFEKGDPLPEAEAGEFLRRACASWEQVGPTVIEGYSFIPKKQAPALCAADLLSWEWQRNYYEAAEDEKLGGSGGQWRNNFKLLFKDENSKPICRIPLGERNLDLIGMINRIAGIHKD